MAFSLADQLFIKQGDAVAQESFLLGRTMQIYIAPLTPLQNVPDVVVISTTGAAINTTTIGLSSSTPITLYRNEVLRFMPGNRFVVIKATTSLTGTVVNVPVFPLESAVASNVEADVYPMLPFLSAKEGGMPDASGSMAEAHNKNMGLYSVSQKYKEDFTATMAGDINFTDPCVPVLNDIYVNGLSKLFVQVRHSVTTVIGTQEYGEGPFAVEYTGVPTAKISDPEGGFIAVSLEMKVSGRLNPYKILTHAVT
jgi:hypothetical protein